MENAINNENVIKDRIDEILEKEETLRQKTRQDERFEVEDIVDEKTVRGNKEYLVKWLNYPKEFNSWEGTKNLLPGCEDLIVKFNNSRAEQQKTKIRKQRLGNSK